MKRPKKKDFKMLLTNPGLKAIDWEEYAKALRKHVRKQDKLIKRLQKRIA